MSTIVIGIVVITVIAVVVTAVVVMTTIAVVVITAIATVTIATIAITMTHHFLFAFLSLIVYSSYQYRGLYGLVILTPSM